MRNFIYGMVSIGLLVTSAPGRADVYKCTAEDGDITFQQTPCPEQKVERVQTEAPAEAALDCSFSNRFAISTARLMRAGVKSDEVFNRYGGLDSLSRWKNTGRSGSATCPGLPDFSQQKASWT